MMGLGDREVEVVLDVLEMVREVPRMWEHIPEDDRDAFESALRQFRAAP